MSPGVKSLFMLEMMLGFFVLAIALHPVISAADEKLTAGLQTMMPSVFGGWRQSVQFSTQIVHPQLQQSLDEIYSQAFARTYVDNKIHQILLSVAYGKNQNDTLQLHKPEICYSKQVFVSGKNTKHHLCLTAIR